MKIEQVQKLSDEKLRIMAAELDGWQYNGVCAWHKDNKVCTLEDQPGGDWGSGKGTDGLPKCESDLNVMFELQNRLFEMPDGYAQRYCTLLSKMGEGWMHGIDVVCFANARQRAEAYVVVMTEKD